MIAVAYEFPRAKAERTDDKEVRIRLDLTLDVPHEIAEQHWNCWGSKTLRPVNMTRNTSG